MKKPRFLFVFTIPVLLSLCPKSTALQTPSIQGSVTDLQSGQPLPDARVALTAGSSQHRTVADTNGRFTFANVAAGEYRVEATREGYLWSPPLTVPTLLTVLPNQDLRNVSIKLLRASAITGRILSNGVPMAGVMVMAMKGEYRTGRRALVSVPPASSSARTFAVTNTDGKYRLYGLEPGDYFIRAAATTLGSIQAPTYYPGTVDIDTASPVTVTPGRDLSAADLNFPNVPMNSAAIEVVASVPNDGARRPEPFVLIQRRDSTVAVDFAFVTQFPSVRSNQYRTPQLPAGSYELFWVQTSSPRLYGHLIFEIPDPDEDLGTLILTPGVTIHGTIQGTQEKTPKPKRVSLIPADGWPGPLPNGEIGQDGVFTITDVPPGDYWVSIAGLSPDAYIETVRFGGPRSEKAEIAVGNKAEGRLEVVIGTGGTVSGLIRQALGQPAPNSGSVIFPADGNRKTNPDRIRKVTADFRGAFTVQGLAPGQYRALAWENAPPVFYGDPSFLTGLESRATKLLVLPGNATAAEIKVLPTTSKANLLN